MSPCPLPLLQRCSLHTKPSMLQIGSHLFASAQCFPFDEIMFFFDVELCNMRFEAVT